MDAGQISFHPSRSISESAMAAEDRRLLSAIGNASGVPGSNWLPTPKDKGVALNFRMYMPKPEVDPTAMNCCSVAADQSARDIKPISFKTIAEPEEVSLSHNLYARLWTHHFPGMLFQKMAIRT